jgi:hypothetical protein
VFQSRVALCGSLLVLAGRGGLDQALNFRHHPLSQCTAPSDVRSNSECSATGLPAAHVASLVLVLVYFPVKK